MHSCPGHRTVLTRVGIGHSSAGCRRGGRTKRSSLDLAPPPCPWAHPQDLTAGDLSLSPQLLNSLSVDPDAECKHGLYFRDGRRKVDYILVYHPKRPSGSRTLARRVQHSDAAPAARGARQDQPLPGKGSVGAVGSPEPPMDYHEDDKRFRREEYEGNLLEAGLELERDEDVTIPLLVGSWGGRAGRARALFPEGGVGKGPLALAGTPRSADVKAAPVKLGYQSLVKVWGLGEPQTSTPPTTPALGEGLAFSVMILGVSALPALVSSFPGKMCPSRGTEDQGLLGVLLGADLGLLLRASVLQSGKWGGWSGLIPRGTWCSEIPGLSLTLFWSTCPWPNQRIF